MPTPSNDNTLFIADADAPCQTNYEDVKARARLSAGASSDPIYEMVRRALADRRAPGNRLLDVGCGRGQLWNVLSPLFRRYIGCDVVAYNGFPGDGEFVQINLDDGNIPLPDGVADVTVSVETIEHLENPRALFRELTRLTVPGGWVVVTTPNQLSLLSKLTLLLKNQFNAFQEGSYPGHITPLLGIDLLRMAAECRLTESKLEYSSQGRIPGTARHYPRILSNLWPRALSDNVLLAARKRG